MKSTAATRTARLVFIGCIACGLVIGTRLYRDAGENPRAHLPSLFEESVVNTRNSELPTANQLVDAQPDSALSLATIRGKGYVLGNLIRDIHSNRKTTPDGKGFLDVSRIPEELQKSPAPFRLDDGDVHPRRRAEYFAAIVTAALDQPPGIQQKIAQALEPFYAEDFVGGIRSSAREGQPLAMLGVQAKKEILNILPPSVHDQFEQITPVKDFLTVAASFHDDTILFARIGSNISMDACTLAFEHDGKMILSSALVFNPEPAIVEFEGFINYGNPMVDTHIPPRWTLEAPPK